jgi:predicted small lipoprotein YifL
VRSTDSVGLEVPPRSKRLRLRALPLLLLTALAACERLGALTPPPDHAVAFVAPAQFGVWWARTEACAGRQGHFEDISWFVVPDVSQFMTPQGAEVGRWSQGRDGTRIVIAGLYLDSELVVRHEMLHALLDREGHPPEYFVVRCHLTWASWGG